MASTNHVNKQLLEDPIAMQTYLELISEEKAAGTSKPPLDYDVVFSTLAQLGYNDHNLLQINGGDARDAKRKTKEKKRISVSGRKHSYFDPTFFEIEFPKQTKVGDANKFKTTSGGKTQFCTAVGTFSESIHQKQKKSTDNERLAAINLSKSPSEFLSRKLFDVKPFGGAPIYREACDKEFVKTHFRGGPFSSVKVGERNPSTLCPSKRENKAATVREYRAEWESVPYLQRL